MLFPSTTFKSLKAGSQQPRFLKAEIPVPGKFEKF